jgi:hypothetical protein
MGEANEDCKEGLDLWDMISEETDRVSIETNKISEEKDKASREAWEARGVFR